MELTELISTVQSHLDDNLDPPVLVAGSDQRPVPGIIIEDWNVEQVDRSMNRYLTSKYDDNGNETARVYRVPYECRVSFMIRDNDEVSSSRLFDALRRELLKIESNPQRLSDSISRASMQSGGGVSHQFVSTTESEFTQTVTFASSLVYEDSDYDRIEDVIQEVVVTDTI
jgi:hypothetical protein